MPLECWESCRRTDVSWESTKVQLHRVRDNRLAEADRKFLHGVCRWSRLARYGGLLALRALKVSVAILNLMQASIGSQWSSFRMEGLESVYRLPQRVRRYFECAGDRGTCLAEMPYIMIVIWWYTWHWMCCKNNRSRILDIDVFLGSDRRPYRKWAGPKCSQFWVFLSKFDVITRTGRGRPGTQRSTILGVLKVFFYLCVEMDWTGVGSSVEIMSRVSGGGNR